MQNILPGLSLRPARVVSIRSGEFANKPDQAAAALLKAGIVVEVESVRMPESHPNHLDTLRAVSEAIRRERQAGFVPVVNMTGGSKLMSLGSFVAGTREKAPVIYVDSYQKCFIRPNAGELPEGPELERSLNYEQAWQAVSLQVLAAAHGVNLLPGDDWRSLVPLAGRLAANHAQRTQAARELQAAVEEFQDKPHTDQLGAWLNYWDMIFWLPTDVGRICQELGWVVAREDRDSWSLGLGNLRARLEQAWDCRPRDLVLGHPANPLTEEGRRYRHAAEILAGEVERYFNFFAGGWLEIAAAESLSRQPGLGGVQWSVVELSDAGSVVSEHDVLGHWQGRLVRISCKATRTRAKLVEAATEAAHAAHRLGGRLAQGVLCSAWEAAPGSKDKLMGRIQREEVQFITWQDLRRNNWFSPPRG